MNTQKPILLFLSSLLLGGVAVFALFFLHNQHGDIVAKNQPFQTGFASLHKQVGDIDYFQARSLADPAWNDSVSNRLTAVQGLLDKMAHGGGAVYGAFQVGDRAWLREGLNELNQQANRYHDLHAQKPQKAFLKELPLVRKLKQGTVDSAAQVSLARSLAQEANINFGDPSFGSLMSGSTAMQAKIGQLRAQIDTETNEQLSWIGTLKNTLIGFLAALCVLNIFLIVRLLRQFQQSGEALQKQIDAENKILQSNAEFAKLIGTGKLESEFTPNGDSDVLGHALLDMRDNLRQVAEDDAKRNWATSGMAKFAELLRANAEDLEELSYNIISNLVKYLEANQGGLFILGSEDPSERDVKNMHLDLTACYAFERKKFLEKRVMVGQGLIGQAVLERDKVYITKIPEDYVNITSGLGQSNPRSILVMPLMVNEEIYGVMEIASFKPFEDYQIEFVEKLAESIASTISGAKINVRTARLLRESQKMTEEMRAQEEEMRQNMEELQATQDEMARKEIEISGQLKAIDQTIASVEFDINGIVTKANTFFLEMMGFTSLEEVRGKHHREFCTNTYAQSEEYKAFWESLRKGTGFQGDVKRLKGNGEEIWLGASYTVVNDVNGQPFKVLKFATDITNQKKLAIDFQSQLSAINKVNATIEFDLQGNILWANDIFLQTTGYKSEDLGGKTYQFLAGSEQANSTAVDWKKLTEGQFQSGIFRLTAKSGKTIWLQGSYNPIFNLEGNPYKIVQIATDHTANKEQEAQIDIQLEEMKAQESTLVENMEMLQASQEEMKRKQREIDEIRKQEKEKTASQIEAQKKIMAGFMEKAKEREAELQARIRELEAKNKQ